MMSKGNSNMSYRDSLLKAKKICPSLDKELFPRDVADDPIINKQRVSVSVLSEQKERKKENNKKTRFLHTYTRISLLRTTFPLSATTVGNLTSNLGRVGYNFLVPHFKLN